MPSPPPSKTRASTFKTSREPSMSAPATPPTAPASTEALRFEVQGMTCATCAARVQKILNKQPGVQMAHVNFAAGEATVVSEAGEAPPLIAAVQKIGFGLTPRTDDAPSHASERHLETARRMGRRFLGSLIVTAPVFVLAMGGVDSGWSRITQAVLTAVVVLVFGRAFHVIAFKRLRSFDANMDTLVSVGTLTAFFYSLWALSQGTHVYFETAAVIVTLILLGRFFEARAKGQA
ncbi:unnamed protein product, partial [Laminaria digitata]